MRILSFIAFVLVLNLSTPISVHMVYGGYVSTSTESKYLRNIDKYKPLISATHISLIDYKHKDSLSFFAKTHSSGIDPFHEWYIDDVGTIRPNSILSKKLDSLSGTYIDPKSKYE